jgi:Outer membrane protein beta-barrel domain
VPEEEESTKTRGPRRSACLRTGVALAASLAVLCVATNSKAAEPRFELGGYGGYLFGDSIEGKSGVVTSQASISGAPSYGGFLDVLVRRGAFAELSYTRAPTELAVHLSNGTSARYDLLVQYLQIGGLLEFKVPRAEWLRPVFGGTLGASIFSADNDGFNYDEWRFSLLFEGGVKIQPVPFFGIRLRARVGATFLTDNSAMFCASGAGCAFAYSGTALIQAELGAGAYLAF